MRIGPVLETNVLKNYQATKPPSANVRLAAGRDEVTFSEEALNFSKIFVEAREEMEMRSPEERAHIEEIMQAVRQGEYRIESEKIADRILVWSKGGAF